MLRKVAQFTSDKLNEKCRDYNSTLHILNGQNLPTLLWKYSAWPVFINFQTPMSKKWWILWWCEEGRAQAATSMRPMGSIRRNSRHSGFSKVRYRMAKATGMLGTTTSQCCGSRMFIPDPGSDFFPSGIPDPKSEFFHPGFRIRIKEFNPKTQTRKNGFLALGNMIRVVHPGSGSWLFTLPGSRGQKAPDPGSGSATLLPVSTVSDS